MNYQGRKAVDLIFSELLRAEEKHPGWPSDPIHATAIIAEETGELVKAALDFYYGRSLSRDEMKKEAAQIGAVVIRFLIGLEDEEESNG